MYSYKLLKNGICFFFLGFNEKVLEVLLQFYINRPEPLQGVKLKPYLGQEVKHIADYEDIEKREWLEHQFKYFSSNRPPSRYGKLLDGFLDISF